MSDLNTVFTNGVQATLAGSTLTVEVVPGTYNRSRGAWVSGTAYLVGDFVTNSNVIYLCTANITGTTVPGSDSGHWLGSGGGAPDGVTLDANGAGSTLEVISVPDSAL